MKSKREREAAVVRAAIELHRIRQKRGSFTAALETVRARILLDYIDRQCARLTAARRRGR